MCGTKPREARFKVLMDKDRKWAFSFLNGRTPYLGRFVVKKKKRAYTVLL
mgnify:CR=1 FL=1